MSPEELESRRRGALQHMAWALNMSVVFIGGTGPADASFWYISGQPELSHWPDMDAPRLPLPPPPSASQRERRMIAEIKMLRDAMKGLVPSGRELGRCYCHPSIDLAKYGHEQKCKTAQIILDITDRYEDGDATEPAHE